MSDNNRNLFIAVILSTLILLGWDYFYEIPRQKKLQESRKTEEQYEVKPQEVVEPAEIKVTRESAINAVRRIRFDNGKIKGSISTLGARIDDLELLNFRETTEENSKNINLFSPSSSENSYFAQFGWVSGDKNIDLPGVNTLWHSNDQILTPSNPIKLTWDNNKGQQFTITVSMDDSYMFDIKYSMHNYSNNAVGVASYGLLSRDHELSGQNYFILHEGPIGVFDEVLTEITYKDLKEKKNKSFKNTKPGSWMGITDKYWFSAIVPASNSFSSNINYKQHNGYNKFQVDYLNATKVINPASVYESKVRLFAGPKLVKVLDNYADKYSIKFFDRVVDFGWLYFLTKPILHMLQFLSSLTGNFGVAILIMTVVVRLALFPLANKSFISMGKMKKLQPKVTEIRETYASDKMQMNKEIMELYKKENVNPLSGCLPIFVQIPVFFALYKVLFVSMEMRHAPFFGWITDLSAPDPSSIFNLFGLLPYSVPEFLISGFGSIVNFGFWPILMGFTMYLQQKLNPQSSDPTQATVMKLLPFIFVFMFKSFPVGLIIYWAWNNTLSILQQWYITRRV